MLRLTDSERRIWEAAYGSAFAARFAEKLDAKGWEKARAEARGSSGVASEAESVADEAVLALRAMRSAGDSTHGGKGAPTHVDAVEE